MIHELEDELTVIQEKIREVIGFAMRRENWLDVGWQSAPFEYRRYCVQMGQVVCMFCVARKDGFHVKILSIIAKDCRDMPSRFKRQMLASYVFGLHGKPEDLACYELDDGCIAVMMQKIRDENVH